ncbi:MAG: hypothetical protein H6923_02045 [Alphaproteobacteria bacterium]|nr:hypothetical protein [Alphaproteobacteria bacterium]
MLEVARQDTSHAAAIAFLDFEASGLGPFSWPIEVGWALLGGEVRTRLIRPHASWADADWDKRAERLHGLSRARLEAEGENPRAVCQALDADLAGATVLSDAPEFDGTWLGVLYKAAGRTPPFRISGLADLLLVRYGRHRLGRAVEEASETVPATHRAGQDVRHLMAIYRLCTADGGQSEEGGI